MPSRDEHSAPIPTDRQNAALAAFVACVVAKLNPTLNAHTTPVNGGCEYDVLIGGTGVGVLHEQIETVLAIAKEHGGRAFISRRRDDEDDRPLCIVWPGRAPSGPDPEGEHDAQVAAGRRKPRKSEGEHAP